MKAYTIRNGKRVELDVIECDNNSYEVKGTKKEDTTIYFYYDDFPIMEIGIELDFSNLPNIEDYPEIMKCVKASESINELL